MLQLTKSFCLTKTLVISLIAALLAACSAGTESTNSPNSSASSPSISSATSSPETTASAEDITIPGVNNVKEISFKAASSAANGFFDGITQPGANGPSIQVPKAAPFNISGWAIASRENKPADSVLITYGDTNSLVAVVPVNQERPDVAKSLNNPTYKNSGWSSTINPSSLPNNEVTLKAWAYSSASKEAIQLNNSLQVVLLE